MITPLANTPADLPRRRHRARRAAKWGLLAASVLVAGVFAASLRWRIDWVCIDDTPRGKCVHWICLYSGGVMYRTAVPYPANHTLAWNQEVTAASGQVFWGWPKWCRVGPQVIRELPLWFPLTLSTVACGILFSLDRRSVRRRRAGQCIKCGYDRVGLAAGAVCPECGTAVTNKQPAPR